MIKACVAAVLVAGAAWAAEPVKTAPAAPKAAPRAFVVGLVASLNDPAGKAQVGQLTLWVRATLGVQAQGQLFTDYEELAKAVEKDAVQVAIMGPLAYLRIDSASKAKALLRTVRKGKSTYRSVLFAKPGSKLNSFDALKKAKNLKAGWVNTSSATGYLVPKATLLERGIDPVQIFVVQDFAGSHDAVCTGVMEGKWDVGATFSDDPRGTVPKATGCETALGAKVSALTIIGASAEMPNDVLVAGPSLSTEEATKLVDGAKKLSAADAGKMVLKDAFLAEGVSDVSAADFLPLKKALDAFKR